MSASSRSVTCIHGERMDSTNGLGPTFATCPCCKSRFSRVANSHAPGPTTVPCDACSPSRNVIKPADLQDLTLSVTCPGLLGCGNNVFRFGGVSTAREVLLVCKKCFRVHAVTT